jgi:acylphosphatase
MADMASLHATVKGRVHGVFFRAYVETFARECKLTGYVRNLPDGTLEVKAEGEKKDLENLVERLKVGPPAAEVAGVAVMWGKYAGEFTGFPVKY